LTLWQHCNAKSQCGASKQDVNQNFQPKPHKAAI